MIARALAIDARVAPLHSADETSWRRRVASFAMSTLIAFDTSTERMTVALRRGDRVVAREGEGGARNVDELFAEIDTLAETADERGEEILGALYEYAEAIALAPAMAAELEKSNRTAATMPAFRRS